VSRPGWDTYYLGIAIAVSARADCTRRQVGAIVVQGDRIVSTGYNGAPSGQPGCLTAGACPRGRLSYDQLPADASYSNCIAVHAEANALLRASWADLRGASLYITDSPCHECSRLISAAGIARVITPETLEVRE
jgi:dCMP deaminase